MYSIWACFATAALNVQLCRIDDLGYSLIWMSGGEL